MRTQRVIGLTSGLAGLAGLAGLGVVLAAAQPGRDSPDPMPPLGAIELHSAMEVREVEKVVDRLYDAISGPAGERDWDAFKALFAADAQLITVERRLEGGRRLSRRSPGEFAKQGAFIMERQGVSEREIARRIQQFGRIAHVWSTYELRHGPDLDPKTPPDERGINSIQLVKDPESGAWKIQTILWDVERDTRPIPDEYLPAGAGDGANGAPG